MNTKRLFVGGIPWATTEATLKQAFEEVGGVISAEIIKDKNTGRSKGYGFVEMSTEEEARQALEYWNGKELEGRKLTVNSADPKKDEVPVNA